MRVIGVLDLLGGRAVHARGGARAAYAPVGAVCGVAVEGDPLALARAYVDRLGLSELYVADLDAIQARTLHHPTGRRQAATASGGVNDISIGRLSAIAPLWLDAGITSVDGAHHALALGAARLIIGLETLDSFDTLSAIHAEAGTDRVAFSLDLRNGVPIAPRLRNHIRDGSAPSLAVRAVAAGAGTVIVLDLARVGTDTGPDLDLIACVRAAIPGTPLIAGGGIRGRDDLARLSDIGCDGALVATALHDGRLDANPEPQTKNQEPNLNTNRECENREA